MTDQTIFTGTIQNPYREFTLNIAAGASDIIYFDHSSLAVLALTGGSMSVQIGNSGSETSVIGSGMGFEYMDGEGRPAAVRNVRIFNRGSTSMVVTVGLAMGKINDRRLSLVGVVTVDLDKSTVIDDKPDVALNNGSATPIYASDGATREVHISNLLSNGVVIRVGSASVGAARGAEVGIGETRIITTAADIYAYVGSAGKSVGVMRVKD